MKKKILISVILFFSVFIGSFCYGFFIKSVKNSKINNPVMLTYYSNAEKNEGFDISIPKSLCEKITVSEKQPIENVTAYTFSQEKTGEILFVVYIGKEEDCKKLGVKYAEIGKCGENVYLWTQSIKNNKNIKDKEAKEEYSEIAKFFTAIKNSIKIKGEIDNENK